MFIRKHIMYIYAVAMMPNRHAIERKMSSFKLSYNACDNAFFSGRQVNVCVFTRLCSVFLNIDEIQTIACYKQTVQKHTKTEIENKNEKKTLTYKQHDIFQHFLAAATKVPIPSPSLPLAATSEAACCTIKKNKSFHCSPCTFHFPEFTLFSKTHTTFQPK